MVYFVRYKERADYGDRRDQGISGREAVDRYAPVDVLEKLGAEVAYFGDVVGADGSPDPERSSNHWASPSAVARSSSPWRARFTSPMVLTARENSVTIAPCPEVEWCVTPTLRPKITRDDAYRIRLPAGRCPRYSDLVREVAR